jgi:hypothetical protein
MGKGGSTLLALGAAERGQSPRACCSKVGDCQWPMAACHRRSAGRLVQMPLSAQSRTVCPGRGGHVAAATCQVVPRWPGVYGA